jgi:hypothetical protein
LPKMQNFITARRTAGCLHLRARRVSSASFHRLRMHVLLWPPVHLRSIACRPHHPLRPQKPAPNTLTHKITTAASPKDASADETPGFLKKVLGENEYSIKFRLRRWLLFSGLVLGYSFYYLCRNSLNYVNPVMVADPSLGLDITKVATLTSIFPIAYGALTQGSSQFHCLSLRDLSQLAQAPNFAHHECRMHSSTHIEFRVCLGGCSVVVPR